MITAPVRILPPRPPLQKREDVQQTLLPTPSKSTNVGLYPLIPSSPSESFLVRPTKFKKIVIWYLTWKILYMIVDM